ncbi:MAG: HNH endonuclease, partial [Allosphingosinicella sp.]
MPQYWWVNHKQTFHQEISGEYLWSPKVSSNGANNEFYNNMQRAAPGDQVLSYADGLIRYVGRVAEFAVTAPKPKEFGLTGDYWQDEGWLLPVFWTQVLPPVSPRALVHILAPLLPKRYSPFNASTGNGNQGAYLASVSRVLFDAVLSNAAVDYAILVRGGANRLSYAVIKEQLEDAVQRQIEADTRLEATVKQSVIQARRGQGKFRQSVEALQSACLLTGIRTPALLNASHIKPWRVCKTADERLDGMNGLMLTPDADRLFDRGFISFDDDGAVRVSERADPDDLRRLGFEHLVWQRFGEAAAPSNWRTGSFHARQHDYLAYHRK